MSDPIRLGIIGLGNMGQVHCKLAHELQSLELTALCDSDTQRLRKQAERFGCAGFVSPTELIDAHLCDALLIATPHYAHTTIGITALKKGYHVLVEKPISAHKADAARLLKAHKNKALIFAAMFNQRTHPAYKAIKALLVSGELGRIQRIQWTITDWFRSQQYYDSGGWRATWAGEGGGVLLNQCPHQLDLLQWLFGMPSSLTATCKLGKYHSIEVEDDVTAVLTFPDGATGVFTTTTGEAPGINRLEIASDNGLVSYDTRDSHISYLRNDKTVSRAIAENPGFEKPSIEHREIPVSGQGGQHRELLANFADAIGTGVALIAPAQEGIHSVELANAMLLSSARGKPVTLPISQRSYANLLRQRIRTSTSSVSSVGGTPASGDKTPIDPPADLTGSF